jgi:amino acid adenylation domain-containing protein
VSETSERLADLSVQEKRALLAQRLQEKAARPFAAPLSLAQERLWIVDQLAPGNPQYILPSALRLVGSLNPSVLRRSFNELVKRQEALRTRITLVDRQAMQIVMPHLRLELPEEDLRGIHEAEHVAREIIVEEAHRPFDLTQGPLLRVRLLRLSDDEYWLFLAMHHIIADGWSITVLVREVMQLYEAFSAGKASPLEPLPIQYVDYAMWQRQRLQGDVLEKQLAYWKTQLAHLPTLALPTDWPRPAALSFQGAVEDFTLPLSLTTRMEGLAAQEEATLFMVLLAAFQDLLHRYSGQDDIVVGSPLANRSQREVEGIIGFFVNMLVFRTELSGQLTFRELLRKVRYVSLDAYAHQDLPFERLVSELQPERDMSRNPLFQVSLALNNVSMPTVEVQGITARFLNTANLTTRFDLSLQFWRSLEGLRGSVRYSTDLFTTETITRMISHFHRLLEAAVDNPDLRLLDLPLLDEAERDRMLLRWNRTQTSYPTDTKCLHELFEVQATLSPDAVAVALEEEQITYTALNRRANQLASYLRGAGIGPEKLVGVYMERSIELIVGLLGVLKAQGAFLPLDPSYPSNRLAFMLKEADVALVLTQQRYLDALPAQGVQAFCLDTQWGTLESHPGEKITGCSNPFTLAYVLYTSGSTGRPKGVLMTHRAICNHLAWRQDTYPLTSKDRFLQKASISFDISVWEIFWPLTAGARLVLAQPEGQKDSTYLLTLMMQEQITTVHFGPAQLQVFLEEPDVEQCRSLTQVFCGGEALSEQLQARFFERLPARLSQQYGPTETCVDATLWNCDPSTKRATIPIGVPIANTRIYLLDSHLRPVPIGVPGEMYIGGICLARGYLKHADLTAERFIADPFSDVPGERLYKTGDLARYRADGNIEFIKRLDRQVKLRGFRIELNEIEATINQYPGVQQCAVKLHTDKQGHEQLVAYVALQTYSNEQQKLPAVYSQPSELVTQWQMVHDQIYAQETRSPDTSFNTVGWLSSYTGQPIPEGEMREWVAQTVARILEQQPDRIFEIGCGTGLLLFRLVPHCTHYYGTDFSPTVLEQLRSLLTEHQPGLAHVELQQRMAHDFEGLSAETFDTVILNSVVQYFPDVAYLLTVLEGALRAVRPGGTIFIGDVRSQSLLSLFHTSVAFAKAPDTQTIAELRQDIQEHILYEEELTIDPTFFWQLAQHFPKISAVQVLLKRGESQNELTKFRYDVLLHVASAEPVEELGSWLDWREQRLSLSSVRQLLVDTQPAVVGFANVPNRRLSSDILLADALASEHSGKNVHDLRSLIEDVAGVGVDPEDLWQLGDQLGYQVDIYWLTASADGSYHVIVQKRQISKAQAICKCLPAPGKARTSSSWSTLANNPLRGLFARKIDSLLREDLSRELPGHMVPAIFVPMDRLPSLPGGKLDYASLTVPARSQSVRAGTVVDPRGPIEEILAHIWSEVLNLTHVSVFDNFFALGGHSLLAMQVVIRLNKALRTNVPLRWLFESPTVAALAKRVEVARKQMHEVSEPPLVPISRDQELPLSFAQERFWFLNQLAPGNPTYLIPVAVSIRGSLNVAALARSLNALVARHETLRTSFTQSGGKLVQVIAASLDMVLPVVDLRALPEGEADDVAQHIVTEEVRRPIDLAQDPMLRLHLLRFREHRHGLIMVQHHISADGWSSHIAIRELSILYQAFCAGKEAALPPLPLQYADFAFWQRQCLQGDRLQKLLDYWKKQLVGAPAVLHLPTDFPRPAVKTYNGTFHNLRVPIPLTEALRAFSVREDATMYMVLLAVFQVLLLRYSGQTDFVVGSPIASRNRPEIESLIGSFVNTLAMRADVSGNPTFRELLGRVRRTTLEAYDHSDLPFDELVKTLQPARDARYSPVFQVVFQFQDFRLNTLPEVETPDFAMRMMWADNGVTQFDMAIRLRDRPEGLLGRFEYNTDLFQSATITALWESYKQLLEVSLAHPECCILDLPVQTGNQSQPERPAQSFDDEHFVFDL